MSNVAARALLVLLATLFVMGCASADPVVKIGLVAPFEGRDRAIGYDAIYSARLAVRQINEAGGVAGHRVALVALDDRGDPELAKQAAASLAVDPGVVVVLGHFLPEITAVAAPVYEQHQLALLPMGETPFAPVSPDSLPPEFLGAYEAITPFDEIAGPFAGPTFDAMGLVRLALAEAEESTGGISRASVQEALDGLKYQGLTGEVYLP